MLRVWFYDPKNDLEGLFNKAVAYSDPPFCHCELQFPNLMTCSIYMGSTVCFKSRTNFGDAYTVLNIPASNEQIQMAYDVCNRNFIAKQQFSAIDMIGCISPWKRNNLPQSKYTFCSKLVAEALEAARILPDNISTMISPSSLYRTLIPMTVKLNIPTKHTQPTPVFDANIAMKSFSQTNIQPAMIIDFNDQTSSLSDEDNRSIHKSKMKD